MNLEEDDTIFETRTSVPSTTALNTTTFLPLPLQPEDVPPRPPPSPQAPSPPETNEVLTNLVNLLCQQSNKLERVERNQEKILTVIGIEIKEVQRNQQQTMPLAVDNANSTPVNR